ncbi:phosphotransferase family protein [Streptacidiphilus sp. N1-3]|uniref:Phosphotransferase family protein n=1 Tax=Streptacidiphilus alkalitolerans TaxID=3342712 RepID=A0ABV6X8I3_9ACTN
MTSEAFTSAFTSGTTSASTRATRSRTQRELSPGEVADLVRFSLGSSCRVAGAAELGGGGFAAVWRVELHGAAPVVLKLSPPPGAELLGYERGLLAVEAEYFARIGRELPGLPVPEVLHHGTDPSWCEGGWLLMTLLPGTPLSQLGAGPADAPVREELGRTLARLHTLGGDEFGYPGEGRRRSSSWREAFLGIIDDLLADAERLGAPLPVPAAGIRAVVAAASPVLDLVRRPALVHFDLWDGNVLAVPGGDSLRLSGLVDGERCLYGDPLVDLVSPVLFGAIEEQPDHPLLRGYAAADHDSGPWRWDEASLLRVRLYRLWLYLVMNVEIPTRALAGPEHRGQREHRAQLLRAALAAVRGRP